MKRLVAFIMTIALVVAGINFTPKQVEASIYSSQGSSSWSLVWSDEFNQTAGTGVNTNYWQYDTGAGGWGNNELQTYTNSTDNVKIVDLDGAVDGKALAITAKRTNGQITSGRIKTLDKQYVKYGKIEARIRTSNGMQPGVWPAFWMMGNDINSVGWPVCGEIDIMEHRNAEAQVISSLHWNQNADGSYSHVFCGSETLGQFGYIDTMDNWHTYAVEWYEDCMKFYVDGNWYETIDLSSEMAEEFHKPHFILLNLAAASTSTSFTQYVGVSDSWSESTMYVDYVRVYQGSDSNFYRAQSNSGQVVTTASPTAGMTACNNDGNWQSTGGVWEYNMNSSWAGATAYYTGGSQNDFTLYLATTNNYEWGAMIRANCSVTSGHTYNYTINYTSTAAGSLLVKEDVSSTGEQSVTVNSGSGSFSGSFTAGSDQSAAQLLMDLRGVAAGTKFSITGFSFVDVTPAETTTAAPTDGMTICTVDQNVTVGKWGYYVGTWAGATARYLGGTALNDFTLKVTASNGSAWGVQAFTAPITVNPGSTYKVSVTLNSDAEASSVVFKDDVSDTTFETKALSSGNNVFTGTYTPTSNTAEFFFDLGTVQAGTTVAVTSFSLEETEVAETTEAAVETTAADTTGWTVVDNSNNLFYYRNAGNISIVNVQQPGFASESGIYMTANSVPSYITINGTKVGSESVGIQGAGAVVYLSALTSSVNTVTFNGIDGTVIASVEIRNLNGSSDEEPTTVPGSEIQLGDIGSSDIAAPAGVKVYNFYAQGQGYRVDFEEVADATAYNVYVGSSSEAVATVSGSGEYIPTSAFSAYADDELHSVYVASVDSSSNISVRSDAAKVRITTLTNSSADPTDVPRVYVVTNEGVKGGSSIIKAEKTAASLTIIGTDGAVQTVSDSGTIKLRGNSTSLADKPAYNISFSSKKEVLSGAAKGKKWCLLANAYDKSMMRSKLGMDLGNALGGLATPDQEYVDVYIDGVYKGLFIISEPADSGRCGMSFDDSDESNEIMFEYEAEKVEDGMTYYTTGLGQRFVTADPEGIDTSTNRYIKWVETLETFESALKKATTSDAVLDYIDVDSFVDMYIANEYFNTVDFGYSSVKYYINNDADGNPIIYAGALWDLDLSSGNYSLEEARQWNKFRCQEVSTWFRYLMQNTTFKNKVIAKFKSMQATIQNIYKDNELGTNQIDKIYEYIKAARIRNYTSVAEGGAGWSESTVDSAEIKYYPYSYGTVSPYSTYTYDQHVEFLRDWLQNRNEWMCEQWGIDYNSVDTGITTSDDIKVTGYQMTSSLDGVDGNMGFRIVYQAEPTVNGQTITEQGLVYGLGYNGSIADDELVYDSTSEYVQSFKATDAGKVSEIMGDSETASYYVMTMNCGSKEDGISTYAYTTPYYVRSYAKLSDGTIVYSDVVEFTIFQVADYIYQNKMASTKATHDYLYSEILSYVDSSYVENDFDWSSTVVQ